MLSGGHPLPTSTRLALITGTSSGIGLALARELLARGWRIVGVSRRPGGIEHPGYAHVCLDLGETARVIPALEEQAGRFVSDPAVGRLALVNNAAAVGLLGPIEHIDAARLLEVYAVNVAAAVSLTGWILRCGRPGAAIRIVNVSSGAAVRPFAGLGAYGSSKAALRMAGMILGAELDAEEARGHAARDVSILSFEPGLVDTEMQRAARASSPDQLPTLAFFTQAAAEGRLMPPELPASAIADYLDGDGHPRFAERRWEPPATA